MARLTPRQWATLLVTSEPDLLLLDPTAQNDVLNGVVNALSFSRLVSWIGQNPPPDTSTPQLPAALLAQLAPALADALAAAAQNGQLNGLTWNVQTGVVPGPQPVAPVGGSWTLTTLTPRAGLAFPSVKGSGAGPTGSFTLSVQNNLPRHVGVYARFSSGGAVVSPAGWNSRLPAGVASSLESDTVKFVSSLAPNVAVAAVPFPTAAQSFTIPLPSNADAVDVLFGGFGGTEGTEWNPLLIAAGTLLTFVFDYAIPAIVSGTGTDLSQDPTLGSWFQGLVSNPSMIAAVLNASAPLAADAQITSVDSLLGAISTNLPGVMTGTTLAPLAAAIDKKLGVGTVAGAAPTLGWQAQILAAFRDWQASAGGTVCPQSRALAPAATWSVPLSPATTVDLPVAVTPDPATGSWPTDASSYSVVIRYGGGFSQQASGAVSQNLAGQRLQAAFGGVPNAGAISIAAAITSSSSKTRASASVVVTPGPTPPKRTVQVTIPVQDAPVTITAATTFSHYCTLDYASGAYLWNAGLPQPSAVQFNQPPPQQSGVVAAGGLTLQQATRSLGYTWQVAGLGLAPCGGGPTLESPYLFQNIGTLNPNSALMTLGCGFGLLPALVYQNPAGTGASSAFYFDPRQSANCLRPVVLQVGTFDTSGSTSVGRFREGLPGALTIHPDGYAAAVFSESSVFEVVQLASAPVTDASAPLSLAYAGPGSRPGLLQLPVGLAVTPDRLFLVLQAGAKAIAAIDVGGNPVPIFGNASSLPLQDASAATPLDIAVSPGGTIYVLGTNNGGATPADCFLDCYTASGTFLTRTTGVTAARIAVDSRERVYTLNYGTLTGFQGRPEPSISVWVPSGA